MHIHGGSAEPQSQARIRTTATLWLPVIETPALPRHHTPLGKMKQKMRTEDMKIILTDDDVPHD